MVGNSIHKYSTNNITLKCIKKLPQFKKIHLNESILMHILYIGRPTIYTYRISY